MAIQDIGKELKNPKSSKQTVDIPSLNSLIDVSFIKFVF